MATMRESAYRIVRRFICLSDGTMIAYWDVEETATDNKETNNGQ